MREERYWPETVVKGFQLVAQVFASALARKRADEALREKEERLSLATNAAGAGLWVMELDTGHVWVTTKTRELFHFAPDEELNCESFFKVVHPEDRERVHKAMQQALQSGENLRSEYRIVLPDRSIRWIVARGQRYLKSTGEPDRMMGVSFDITERKRVEERLQANLREIAGLKQRLEEENIYLRKEAKLLYTHEEIIGQSEAIRKVLADIERVAQTDATVLITGETGTGKELIARAIHNLSNRRDRVMVTVNCASLPPTLIESELFGREKGAYTGALTRQMGRFEIADGSTLFLDEIGELPSELQAKFLKVLQNGEFERVGSVATIKVDVRIIAATNRNLAEEIRRGKFRQDLFYRMNVFPIKAPSLREHPEDIPLLINSLVEEFSKRMGKRIHSVPRKTMEDLQRYSWPGNVRELRNLIEQAFIISSGDTLRIQVPREKVSEHSKPLTADEMERQHIMKVLEMTKWRIKGSHGAAEILGLKPSTLYSRMVKFGITSRHKKDDI
jgi:PAS domain S-box-containing protein